MGLDYDLPNLGTYKKRKKQKLALILFNVPFQQTLWFWYYIMCTRTLNDLFLCYQCT